jgi:hypothetical protein
MIDESLAGGGLGADFRRFALGLDPCHTNGTLVGGGVDTQSAFPGSRLRDRLLQAGDTRGS